MSIKVKSKNKSYLNNSLDDYGLGSWLGRNIGNVAQVVGGAVLTATGAGATVGIPMMISGGGGVAKDAVDNKQARDQVSDQLNTNQLTSNQAIAQKRLGEYNANNTQQLIPTMGLGGNIDEQSTMKGYGYNMMGNGGMVENPAWYRSNALSMAKGGSLPKGTSTLKEAKEFVKLYPKEMEFGQQTEFEHTGNKTLALRIAADHVKDSIKINQGGEPDYYQKLQAIGISDELNKMPQMGKGGFLSVDKAKEILKDGTIKGKKITDRQKRYFGFIAGGGTPNKIDGGILPSYGTGGLLDKLPSTGRILDNNKTGNLNNGQSNNPTIFTEYRGGGTHEESSIGGIPIGDKARVEDGETRVALKDGDYIFSDKILYNKK
jgi:hypothetical protein